MSPFDAIILGVVQGITEFLPISSSGHLILVENFLRLDVDQLKSFDIALHLGTLFAVLVYFFRDILALFQGFWEIILRILAKSSGKLHQEKIFHSPMQKQVGYLVLASMPAVIVGGLGGDFFDNYFRHSKSVAFFLVFIGLLFFVAEYFYKKMPRRELNLKNSFIIGLVQALALIPGVSRSGSTIAAGIGQGVEREQAARFSFLLGAIVTFGALCLGFIKIARGSLTAITPDVLVMGIVTSFIFGIFSIGFLMKFLKNHSLGVFGAYRIVFGILILLFL